MGESSWHWSTELLRRFLTTSARLPHLLERLPAGMDAGTRRATQSLLYGAVRHLGLLRATLGEFVRKRPKPALEACLLVASYELLEAASEREAPIVDHAVSQIKRRFSRAEAGLANAVLRKMAWRLRERIRDEPSGWEEMAERYSHPLWRVKRWGAQFGVEETRAFLKWNLREPEVYVRPAGRFDAGALEEILEPSPWTDFFRVRRGRWRALEEWIERGQLYVQDPSTAMAPRMLAGAVRQGRLLDLCAAPGGKGLLLDRYGDAGVTEIVLVDLAGPRFDRLVENVRRYGSARLRTHAGDALELDPSRGLYEGVLLDAPCSNSGVLQRKVDAKWRLEPAGFGALVSLQRRLLARASERVAPGGSLVYSTCSVDAEENRGQIDRFLASVAGKGFQLIESLEAYPWREGRDGAASYLLQRARG